MYYKDKIFMIILNRTKSKRDNPRPIASPSLTSTRAHKYKEKKKLGLKA